MPSCRENRDADTQAEYLKYQAEYRTRNRDRAAFKRRERAKEVADYKASKPCSDCGGYFHPAVMEFDHRPGEQKLFNIGTRNGTASRNTVWAEIAKCDLVCANCHRMRTVERRSLPSHTDASTA